MVSYLDRFISQYWHPNPTVEDNNKNGGYIHLQFEDIDPVWLGGSSLLDLRIHIWRGRQHRTLSDM